MKRLVRIVLLILVLTLVLAAPAAATKPTGVSGKWTDSAYKIPPPPPCEQRGPDTVTVTAPMWHIWGDGSFRGRSDSDWLIHARDTTCETTLPNASPAKLHATGTFVGDLCLGTWNGDDCQGEKYSGSFDFSLEWRVTDPCPAPCTKDAMSGKLVILKGYGGLAGLHGVLDCWGRTGPKARGGRVSYAGQVHLDP